MDAIFLLLVISLSFLILLLSMVYSHLDSIGQIWGNIRTHLPFRVYSGSTINNREAEFLNDKLLNKRIFRSLIDSLMKLVLLLTVFYFLIAILT